MIRNEFRHGDDGYRYNREVIADFSTNTWYLGPDPELIRFLQEAMPRIQKYPELQGESFTCQLADHHQLAPDQILVTNGTAEAIFLIAQAYMGDSSRIITPTFSEYEHACGVYGHRVSFCGSNFIAPKLNTPDGLFWMCNPNNPTGQVFKRDLLRKIVKDNPQTIFIIDEAYSDFCLEDISLVPDIPQFRNLIILKSLTKNHCLPGLRVGYLMAHQMIRQKIAAFRPPWSVNTLAQVAGEQLLKYPRIKPELLLEHHAMARSFQAEIATIPGFEVLPSSTGFFLVKTPHNATELKETLVNEYGLLIRDASNFKTLSPNHIRLATLSRYKNDLLIKALKEVTQSVPAI